MRAAIPIVFLLSLCLSLLVSLPVVSAGQEQDTKAQEKPDEIQVEVPEPLIIPEAEKSRKNPVKANAASAALGRKLFSSQCAMCHGIKGNGKGDLALELQFNMPDFTQSDSRPKRTDGELYYIITKGHGEMPGQGGRLRAKQKWDMINFIRSQARRPK